MSRTRNRRSISVAMLFFAFFDFGRMQLYENEAALLLRCNNFGSLATLRTWSVSSRIAGDHYRNSRDVTYAV